MQNKLKPDTESRVASTAGRVRALQHASAERIRDTVMRAGGEPFGAPLGFGVLSLAEKVVRLLRQRGFFSFESVERLDARGKNKFTRYGASRFWGEYRRSKNRR